MTEPAKIPAADEIWSHFDLDEFAKVIAILGGIAYATGVIAVNTYLHGLGIVDFSFARPKLLLTGIVVLFTYLLLAGPAFLLAWSMATRHEQVTRRLSSRHLRIWLAVALILLLGASVFYCLKDHPGMGQSTIWKVWGWTNPGQNKLKQFLSAILVALMVYLPILVATAALYWAARLLDQERAKEATQRISPRQRISPWGFFLAIAATGFVMATIVYIYLFTNTFYSAIPQEYGGGQPYFQSFAIGKDDLCEVQQLGIPFALGQSNVTQPLPVLYETDTLVAVWLKDTPRGSWNFVVAVLDKKAITVTKVVAKPESQFPPPLTPLACKD